MIILGILVSFVMFSIIVLLHEYGHYKTAKIFGIHIEEFGLGIPPRAKKLWKNKEGTLFSLNWIPLGGFVKIAGESEIYLSYYTKKGKILTQNQIIKKINSGDDLYNKSGSIITKQECKLIQARLDSHKTGYNFYEKNIFAKSAVLLAGVVMNFLLAGVIFSTLFFVGLQPIGINTFIETNTPSKIIPSYEEALSSGILIEKDGIILYPIEGSLAESSGIMQGDILNKINGKEILNIEMAQNIIQNSKNQTILFTISTPKCQDTGNCPRYFDNENISVNIGDDGLIGSYLSPNVIQNEDFVYKYGIFDSLKYGTYETYAQIRLTLSGLGFLVKNILNPETPEDRQEAIDGVAGPIGIVGVVSNAISGGIVLLLILGAIISINLGVFNLLPIPALDGGRILLLWVRSIVDALFGNSRLFGNIENSVHVIFFMLLIALSILIAYNDIIKIFSE